MIWKIVRPVIRTVFRAASRLYLALDNREYRYVFVLGHMRSGSTLLAHILANHPDFVGAGEMHVLYRTPADLPKLVLKTCEFLHKPVLRETYIVDQINHDFVTDEVLISSQVYKCIILIREPEATLKSMMSLSIWQEKEALDAYIKRLKKLTQYAMLLRERALLVDYDDLVDHTENTLAALTSFLGVNPPFASTYMTQRTTGKVGDPSGNILSGRIIRTPRHADRISADVLAAAHEAFSKHRQQLLASGALSASRKENQISVGYS
jgi:Sulfotransferase family